MVWTRYGVHPSSQSLCATSSRFVNMPANRRNYYRLLHVQADAPAEVIKASYRALMLLNHPDRGGDHAEAVLLNEAYAVLCDAEKRKAYDVQRAARADRSRGAASEAKSEPKRDSAKASTGPRCPLCKMAAPTVIGSSTRCTRCRAPLAPVSHASDKQRVVERRSMPRVSKSDWALLYVDWPSDVIDVRMRDLSLDGISVYSGAEQPLDQTIRVAGAAFDVVATIVSCRRVGKVFTLHARLVTALFTAPTGGFVSTTA